MYARSPTHRTHVANIKITEVTICKIKIYILFKFYKTIILKMYNVSLLNKKIYKTIYIRKLYTSNNLCTSCGELFYFREMLTKTKAVK